MGIMDRDYYAERQSGGWTASGRWNLTAGIIVTTSVLFLLQHIGSAREENPLWSWGSFQPQRLLSGEVWRLLTPLVLHDSIWQLLANMLLVYWAGSRLEAIHGPSEYGAYYLTAGLLGYATGTVVYWMTPSPAQIVLTGANPAVAATLILFACHFPRQQVLLFFVLPIPAWTIAALYVGLDLLVMLERGWLLTATTDLAGAAFGLLYYRYHWQLTGHWRIRWRRRTRPALRPTLRVTTPPDSDSGPIESATASGRPSLASTASGDFEAEVDRVLAKVSQQGQASLTPEERALLFQASELYKKRRR